MQVIFFRDTATTEIYTRALHEAHPISTSDSARTALASGRSFLPLMSSSVRRRGCSRRTTMGLSPSACPMSGAASQKRRHGKDRKSTRLNSSHANISYAVFCLKKKLHLIIPNTLHCHSSPHLSPPSHPPIAP